MYTVARWILAFRSLNIGTRLAKVGLATIMLSEKSMEAQMDTPSRYQVMSSDKDSHDPATSYVVVLVEYDEPHGDARRRTQTFFMKAMGSGTGAGGWAPQASRSNPNKPSHYIVVDVAEGVVAVHLQYKDVRPDEAKQRAMQFMQSATSGGSSGASGWA